MNCACVTQKGGGDNRKYKQSYLSIGCTYGDDTSESIRLLYSVKRCDELTIDHAHLPVARAHTEVLN